MPNASRSRRLPRLRRILALATDNWPARGYLAVVGVSVLAMFPFPDSALGARSLMLTAPLSFLSVFLPFGPGTEGGGVVEVLALAYWVVWLLLCAFVNAAVIGALSAGFSAAGTSADAASAGARTPLAGSGRLQLRGIRALLAPAVDNWPARAYLAVVAAALGSFLYAVYVSSDPGFAGIWPLMATAPLSFFVILLSEAVSPGWDSSLDWLSTWVFFVGTALSGLFNAVLLGLLARRLRAPAPRPAA